MPVDVITLDCTATILSILAANNRKFFGN